MANEKRLIDANAMYHRLNAHIAEVRYKGLKAVPTTYESCNPTEYLKGYERGAIETANLALGQQIVDAVEVVRCKDCKHCIYISYACGDVRCGKLHSDYIKEDGFCNYGERREGDV